jgi:hypothetical protein
LENLDGNLDINSTWANIRKHFSQRECRSLYELKLHKLYDISGLQGSKDVDVGLLVGTDTNSHLSKIQKTNIQHTPWTDKDVIIICKEVG